MAFKVETVGDAYMVAFGLMPEVRDDEDPSLIAMTALRVAAAMESAAANIGAASAKLFKETGPS